MRILLTILFSMIIGVGLSQRTAPTSLPSPNSTGYSKVGFYRGDSAFLMGPRLDTNWVPVTQAIITFKPNGQDTGRLFYYDGRKWKEANSIDTSSLSNRINLKVDSVSVSTDSFYYWVNGNPNFFYKNVDSFYYTISQLTDTSMLIHRSDGILDTIEITSGDASLSLDTTSLSNRINLKLNISDTTAMLLPYLRKDDTTAMISPYIRYAYRTPGVDSIYFVKGSGAIIAVKDSAGGGGTSGTLNDSRLVFSANGEVKDTSTLVYSRATGNVGIGGTPDASAQLDVSSTTKGFLPPRMATAERDAISSPANGLTVFQTTNNVSQYHDGNAWRNAGADSSGIINAARLMGSNTIAESLGCTLSTCQTATTFSTGTLKFQAVYIPHKLIITGASIGAVSTVTSASVGLYRLDSDSLRRIDTSGTAALAANSLTDKNFNSTHEINPGIYYVAINPLNSAGSLLRSVTVVNVNMLAYRSSRTNVTLSATLSGSALLPSYHFNQLTRANHVIYLQVY